MRIITQDKAKSIEFDGTEISVQYGNVLYQSGTSKGRLGAYDNEHEASAVFADMHKQWREDCMSVFEMPEN